MVLRFLFRFLSNIANSEQIVSKLADSYPIRRSAQLLASIYHRSNTVLKSGAISSNPYSNRLLTFKNRFLNEFHQEMQNAKSKLKK